MSLRILFFALIAFPSLAQTLQLDSVTRIWSLAPHSAFGDLIRFRNQWFAVFREGRSHVATAELQQNDGKLRVIRSKDGRAWSPAALLEEPGVDLRDPHLSITADGRLMIVAGGSVYRAGTYRGRQPRVAFSKDGTHWSQTQRVLEEGHWLWRVTWYQGKAYGLSKFGSPGVEEPGNPRRGLLVSSSDGVDWKPVTEWKLPGVDETTLRFLADGTMVALVRNEVGNHHAWIGHSKPPYQEWQWNQAEFRIGGPNFLVLPDGTMWAGGRLYPEQPNPPRSAYRTFLGRMDLNGYRPLLTLPSGGDTSYPGLVWFEDRIWMLYYSSHEEKTAIYLARIRLKK